MRVFIILLVTILLVSTFISMVSVFGWYTILIYLGFFIWFYITAEGA